jgi:diguanylate cyclase (GGDEF)-like protein
MDTISIVKKYFALFTILLFIVVFSVLAFLYLTTTENIYQNQKSSLHTVDIKNKKELLRSNIGDIIVFLESRFKKLSKEGRIKEDIVKEVLQDLRYYRFFNDQEIIIFDKNKKTILSTFQSDISQFDIYSLTDNNQNEFIKKIYLMAQKNKDGGYISYSWDRVYQKTNYNNKIAYAQQSELLNMIFTGHLYLDNKIALLGAEKEKKVEQGYIYLGAIFIIVMITLFVFISFMVKKLRNIYAKSVAYFLEEIKKDTHIIEDDGKFYGFGKVISYCNTLYFKVQKYKKEIHKLQSEIKDKATTDYLTGFANRKYFYSTCGDIISIASRERTPLSFIVIGIDDFEGIGDEYGYEVTDEILHDVANIIKSSVRDCDIATRLYNGEIMLLLYNTPSSGSLILLNRIKKKISDRKILFKGQEVAYNTYLHHLEFNFEEDKDIDDVIHRMRSAIT